MSKKIIEVRFKLRNLDQIQAHNLFIESNKAKHNSVNELLSKTYMNAIQDKNLENNKDIVQELVREEMLKATKLLFKAEKNYTDDLSALILEQLVISNFRNKFMFNMLAQQLGMDLNLLNDPGEDSKFFNELDCIKEFTEKVKIDYEV